jgi:hypothetical protein
VKRADLTPIAVAGLVAVALGTLVLHLVLEARHDVAATVLERSSQSAHTEAGVRRFDTSAGKGTSRHYQAQLRAYPDRYWLRVHRKRLLAADTYEFQVDRRTWEAAKVGERIDHPHGYRADYQLLDEGPVHDGGAAYAWEPAWDDAHELAREHDADIERSEVWF